jgi:hypothetical protein
MRTNQPFLNVNNDDDDNDHDNELTRSKRVNVDPLSGPQSSRRWSRVLFYNNEWVFIDWWFSIVAFSLVVVLFAIVVVAQSHVRFTTFF